MTKQEKVKLQRAVRLLWQSEEPDAFEQGILLLCSMCGLRIPALEATRGAKPVNVLETYRTSLEKEEKQREKDAPT